MGGGWESKSDEYKGAPNLSGGAYSFLGVFWREKSVLFVSAPPTPQKKPHEISHDSSNECKSEEAASMFVAATL